MIYYNIWNHDFNRWTNARHTKRGPQNPNNPFLLTKEEALYWINSGFIDGSYQVKEMTEWLVSNKKNIQELEDQKKRLEYAMKYL